MPFTVSHVAAVIPGHRPLARARVFSAAVIGSMVPDIRLLLPEPLAGLPTHSRAGLIEFCLPIGLIVYLLTEWWIKPAVLEVLPDGAYLRLTHETPAPFATVRHWLRVVTALLLGAVTHLVWDGFTHESARGVRMFPVLGDYGPDVAGHSVRLYAWLQVGSSVVGLAVVLAALALWLRHTRVPAAAAPVRLLASTERALWRALYLVLPLLATLHGWQPRLSAIAISGAAVDSLRGAAFSLLAVSALLLLRLRWARRLDVPQGLR